MLPGVPVRPVWEAPICQQKVLASWVWHSPIALATSLTRSAISSSPTPSSASAPATCSQIARWEGVPHH